MSDEASLGAQHEHLRDAVQSLVALDPQITDGSFLVGYALVAEFADPDGTRWFINRQGDASGEGLYPWIEEGYLRQGLKSLARREDIGDDDDGED